MVVRDARCHTAIHGMAVGDQDRHQSDHTLYPEAPPTLGRAAVITMSKADGTLRTLWAVPHPND